MFERKLKIYRLIDPLTKEVRYIGKTEFMPSRFKDHISDGRYGHSPKDKWIRSLLLQDLVPIMEEIETTMHDCRENFWIGHYRSEGAALFNRASYTHKCPTCYRDVKKHNRVIEAMMKELE